MLVLRSAWVAFLEQQYINVVPAVPLQLYTVAR